MWLQREKGLAVIEKMLGLMFGLCKPSNNEKIFGKYLTYWHWIEASEELKERYGQKDLNTGWWYEPKDLNNWIIPLVGKIWEAYNYTMLVFCVRKWNRRPGRTPSETSSGRVSCWTWLWKMMGRI